ncbi:MAG: M20/M25/M40 family metallo-hydrolase, partial [Bacteroidales bacterium]|nr:M20/M25/M40 family metallo-hydrolase [Bacteroidales bacterium]
DIFKNDICQELKYTESQLVIELAKTELPKETMTHDCQTNLLNAIYGCPNGPIAMSHALPGLVETSTNLASVKIIDEKIVITTSQRSSVASRKQDAAERVSATFYMIGADVESSDGYPGWTPNPDSEVLKMLVKAYEKCFNKQPIVKAIHAGLECGLFAEKYPDLDMVSIGPTLRGVHSPVEKLEIKTVKMTWDLVVEFLKSLK